MSRPWDKWYADRWFAEPTLKKCRRAARSLWFDCLNLMMIEGGDRLEIKGQPCTEHDLAREFGDDYRTIRSYLAELERYGVFDRDQDGCIVSRMRRKELQYLAEQRARGRLGGNPALAKSASPGPENCTPYRRPTDALPTGRNPTISKINGFHEKALNPRIKSPESEEEEDARACALDPLFRNILIAAGFDPDGALPPWWRPPGAAAHVRGWRSLGMTDDQIALTVTENRKQHALEIPDGPRAFDRDMQRQAAALAAPPPEPNPQHGGTTNANRRRGHKVSRDEYLDAVLRGAARE